MWIGHGLIDTVETKYTYDILGALTRVVLPDATVLDYVIDGQSRRVGKKRNGQLVQGFLYRDQLRIAAELDASSTIVSRFVYADKANVPELMVRAGATYRLLTDHLGSVRLVVNTSTGAIAQQMDYDAFGVVKLDSNPGFQPFGFAGGLYDPETELVRFGARDYDPRAGRWIGKDPIGFAGDGPNLYAYTFNDPVSFTDATGEAVTPPHSVDDSQDDAFECGPKKGPKRSKRGECLDRCEQGHQFDGGLLSQAKVTEAEGALLGGRLRK